MVWVERNEAEDLPIAVPHGSDLLAQSERADFRTVGRLQMLNGFPVESSVAIKVIPMQTQQPAEARDDLAELARFEAKEHRLELRAVEIELHSLRTGARDCAALASLRGHRGWRYP